MKNYFRITAYHPKEDISVILDSLGKFEKLWQFSSYLIGLGFKIKEVAKAENIIEATFEPVTKESDKILLRAVNRGEPEISEMTYNDRPCKSIAVYDRLYGQFAN